MEGGGKSLIWQWEGQWKVGGGGAESAMAVGVVVGGESAMAVGGAMVGEQGGMGR